MSEHQINLLVETNKAILERLETIEKRVDERFDVIEKKLDNVLAFVSVGNEDLAKKLPKLKKA